MAPLELEGETLGERHRHYNKLVSEAVTEGQLKQLDKINHNDNDIDNLLKIDVASKNKDVYYILEVLKCDDMLYVSRALKQCVWLITDQQYAHIVNPTYLPENMFPHMTTKSINKLMMHIRIHLKDEKRLEAFYFYQFGINPKAAFKWLPHCPIHIILKEVERHRGDISLHILKRCCQISPYVLSPYLGRWQTQREEVLKATMFLARKNTDVYLDVIDSTNSYYLHNFGPKASKIFLKKYPERIINNFAHYVEHIDLPTVVKYIKKELSGVKEFLLKEAEKGKQEWFKFSVLKHFLKEIPRTEIFDLLKTMFHLNNEEMEISELFYAIEKCDKVVPANVYRWFEFAPFHVARRELQKLIYAESSPEERQSILSVFWACASRNPELMQKVLQYYHDRHINEPYKFKIPFVASVIEADTHRFDEKSWNLLNNIFHSMELYIVSDHEICYYVCAFLDAIIVYKVLHDENISEVIKDKFIFDTMKSFQKRLNEKEREKLFKYLFNFVISKMQKQDLKNESEFKEAVQYLESFWNLLNDWKKEQQHHKIVFDKIKEILEVKKHITWTVDLSNLYKMLGRWRRYLFDESLSLSASEETCVNALKHSPQMLARHRIELNGHHAKDPPRRLLHKFRLYYPHSFAKQWSNEFLTRISNTKEHDGILRGLYTLLPPEAIVDFIKSHAPPEKKIRWNEGNETELSLRKYIAIYMHLARPSLSIDLVLKYAKGDYLKHAQVSLNVICNNQRNVHFRENVHKLLNAPVSVKKHGIRLASKKFSSEELKPIFCQLWASTKNRTIRTMIFTMTFELLCKENRTDLKKELWEFLSNCIDDLTHEENKEIYYTLAKDNEVPHSVRPEFYVKCYKILTTLPEKSGCSYLIGGVTGRAADIMEYLDTDFVLNILLASPYNKFLHRDFYDIRNICAYILCSKNEHILKEKCDKFLDPIFNRAVAEWKKEYSIKFSLESFCKELCGLVSNITFGRQMVVPVQVFSKVLALLKTVYTVEFDYTLQATWKLAEAFLTMIDDLNKKSEGGYSWHGIINSSISQFGEICRSLLQDDMEFYFRKIYLLFADSFKGFCRLFGLDDMYLMELIKAILNETVIETYLLGIMLLPGSSWRDEHNEKQKEIRRILYAHESIEVKMHYLHHYSEDDL